MLKICSSFRKIFWSLALFDEATKKMVGSVVVRDYFIKSHDQYKSVMVYYACTFALCVFLCDKKKCNAYKKRYVSVSTIQADWQQQQQILSYKRQQ